MRSPGRLPPASRPRMNSKDIPRTYSGLYGDGNDLLPFELSRNRNTDWMTGWLLLGTYLIIILCGEFIFMALLPMEYSWTVAHVVHFTVTYVYLHWIKGSPNFYEQGEMNHLTTWEQLDSTTGMSGQRTILRIVPTVLCYAACHFCHYNPKLVLINVLFWMISMLAKMKCMNGYRFFGINRTTGIDDDKYDDVLKKD